MIIVKCKNCNKEFKTTITKIKKGGGKFCSRECYHPKVDYGIKSCIICNKDFSKKLTCSKKQWELIKCCSRDCANKYKKRLVSPMKGKHLSDITKQKLSDKNKGKHYSLKTEFKKGNSPPNKGVYKATNTGRTWFKKGHKTITPFYKGMTPWNKGLGNKTPKDKKIRKSIEYSLWREAVFARDNWTCQKTGVKGGRLHPHHIYNFAQYPELRFAIDNGITLSEKSHIEFHKKYGKTNNTKEQIIEFLSDIKVPSFSI